MASASSLPVSFMPKHYLNTQRRNDGGLYQQIGRRNSFNRIQVSVEGCRHFAQGHVNDGIIQHRHKEAKRCRESDNIFL
jgi:hypothetical protein